MEQQQTKLLGLKNRLDHLATCQEQLQWADDNFTVRMLTEAMIHDLECCRSLCEALRQPRPLPVGA